MVVNKRLHKYTIEALISDVKEIYKSFPFDLLVVDYPQLLSAEGLSDYGLTMVRVYRGLHMIAQDCNCSLLAPAQSGRNFVKIWTKLWNMVFYGCPKSYQ